MAPPEGFTSLRDAINAPDGTLLNVMGVVVDFLPPKPPDPDFRRLDWMSSFHIRDTDIPRDQGVKVRYFHRSSDELAQVKSVGDVVLLRDVRVKDFGQNRAASVVLTGNYKTSSVVFPEASIPAASFKVAYAGGRDELRCICSPSARKPNMNEQMYAIDLKHHISSTLAMSAPNHMAIPPPAQRAVPRGPANPTVVVRPQPPPGALSPKFSLISDVVIDRFYDVVVEVVKTFSGSYDGCELHVTDYTVNSLLFNFPSPQEGDDGVTMDGDPYNYIPGQKRSWPGPYGSRTVKVEVKEPHASYVRRKVHEGSIVLLRNVRMKFDGQNKMEANMYQDSRNPERVHIQTLPDGRTENEPAVKEFFERKDKYWKGKKRPATRLEFDGSEPPAKKQKQKQKKKQKKTDEANQALLSKVVGTDQGNEHIRCSHVDVSLSTISNILSLDRTYKGPSGVEQVLPFINQCRRAQVRVIDFYPETLEDFTRPSLSSNSINGSGGDIDFSLSQTWEWDFFLLVEDARKPQSGPNQEAPQLWLHVRHPEAQFLHNLDASDLSHDQEALGTLREKLAILWGNLEERKLAAREKDEPYPPVPTDGGAQRTGDPLLSNRPFACCIKEYGQEIDESERDETDGDDFVRIHGLFETKIM